MQVGDDARRLSRRRRPGQTPRAARLPATAAALPPGDDRRRQTSRRAQTGGPDACFDVLQAEVGAIKERLARIKDWIAGRFREEVAGQP